jgi:hypothetical protein
MNEEQWLACEDPKPMLEALRGKASDRKLILFTLACAYRNPRTLVDPDHQKLSRSWDHQKLYRSWGRYVEGLTSLEEVNGVYKAFTQGRDDQAPKPYDLAVWDAYAYASNARDRRGEVNAQVATLHDLFGPLPFRPLLLDPAWLTWHDGLVVRLAQVAYEEWHLPAGRLDNSRLWVLADALEEAGCLEAGLLSHLRSPGPHVRGCWAVDLVLGKS